jgi:septal ring factor EnvC (AmiA/AmiB activator)
MHQELKESTGALAANKRENSRLRSLLRQRDTQITRLEAELRAARGLKKMPSKCLETQNTGKKSMNKGVATHHTRIQTLETQVKTLTNGLRHEGVRLRILGEQLKDAARPAGVEKAPMTGNESCKRQLPSTSSKGSQDGEAEHHRDGPPTKKPKAPNPAIEDGREKLVVKLLEEFNVTKQEVGLSSPPST